LPFQAHLPYPVHLAGAQNRYQKSFDHF